MPALRDELIKFALGWQDDLSTGWKKAVEGVELDAEGVDANLQLGEGESIFPCRKGGPRPGAPAGAHVFKVFDRLQPKDVRAVVIGQDPYPRLSRATGRAFEQGDIDSWLKGVTTSMKSLLLTLAAERSGQNKYFLKSAWSVLQADMKSGALALQASPAALFDFWEDQGVLFLNAGLTLSHFVPGGSPEQRGHIQFWSPLVRRIIRYLVERTNKQLVILTWGQASAKVVKSAGVMELPAWNVTAGAALHAHPASAAYWSPPNPLGKASELLKSYGGGVLTW